MIHRSGFLLIYLIFLHSFCGWTQQGWSLEECIAYALEHNIQLQQKSIQTKRAALDLRQSRLYPLPALNAGLTETNRFGRTADPLTYEFNTRNSMGTGLTLSGSADLFQGFKQIYTIRANRFLLDQSLLELERARKDLGLAITKMYLQILFQEDWVIIAREQAELAHEQVAKARILVNAGVLNLGDQLEMEAQLAQDELQVVQAENDLEMAYLDLIQVLDLKEATGFIIRKPLLKEPGILAGIQPTNQVFATAVEKWPAIQGAQSGLKAMEQSLLAAKGSLWPSFRLNTMWGTGFSDRITDLQTGNVMRFADQLGYTSSATIHFTIDIPIFNGLSRQHRIQNAKLDLLEAQYTLDITTNELYKEIQQVQSEIRTSCKLYQSSQRSMAAFEEAFRYAHQRFNHGMLTSVDLNSAKKDLSVARSAWLQSKYRYLFNVKIQDFYLGLPLKLE